MQTARELALERTRHLRQVQREPLPSGKVHPLCETIDKLDERIASLVGWQVHGDLLSEIERHVCIDGHWHETGWQ
jgi:hypothetical protein